MTTELWIAVLSSSLVSGIAGGLIAGAFGLRAKRNDYVNEYYKIVLSRRIEAYTKLEELIVLLKSCVVDEDRRPYHVLFSKEENVGSVYQLMFDLISRALWFSDDLFAKTLELNVLLFPHKPGEDSLVEFGKEHYAQVAELRTQLEKLHVRDMLVLHKIPRFLKNKKSKDAYEPIAVPAPG